ncbi:AAT-domain-containing protein [Myriangium duriaei CBS 260.36]|uniref:AAT-domain-containing protein n=1 Tax=Myriangium duriaei CBS 260.36 TaxID=1168546 RepID=A0A9P4J288_9PEZI|nr:AAT-domain-containing protein [Myriangium duriaei CBS 260.36]
MTTTLPQIECFGTPYEIGFAHGTQARTQIAGSIRFYTRLFQENCKKSWPEVQTIADQFVPQIRKSWPDLLEEMEGVADGAQTDLLTIVALNVRTEINFGLFSDGCTALSWRTEDENGGSSFLAQNWDWETPQRENLVLLDVRKANCPRIKMVTEAGIIGKIGMNENGVGVCLNAIREKGMDATKIPCHLGLRMVLESRSRDEAVAKLEKYGVASSCHMLVADATGGVGLEWNANEGRRIHMNNNGQVFHSNHFVHRDMEGKDKLWLEDSKFRIKRVETLCRELDGLDMVGLQRVFRDEENYPAAICRKQEGGTHSETLFNIIMDLTKREMRVTVGRPVHALEQIDVRC